MTGMPYRVGVQSAQWDCLASRARYHDVLQVAKPPHLGVTSPRMPRRRTDFYCCSNDAIVTVLNDPLPSRTLQGTALSDVTRASDPPEPAVVGDGL